MPQERDDIRRHDDGSIDIRFYAERAVALRRAAKAEFMARAVAAIGRGWAALSRGQKAVVEVASQERPSALDDHLWTCADGSFLPHVTAMEADAAQNPIVPTTKAHGPNAA